MKWIDVSLSLGTNTVHWPGHPRYKVGHMMSMEKGDAMNVTMFSMCSHFGTHVDAPRHYHVHGTSVDQLSLDLLVGPCRVVEYPGTEHIPEDFIQGLELEGVQRLLIRTRNSFIIEKPDFHEDYIALTPGAARALVDTHVQLLGVDGYSIGPYDHTMGKEVHEIFLISNPDRIAIEEINLSNIKPGDYQLVALPLKLKGLEGAPVRVLLGINE